MRIARRPVRRFITFPLAALALACLASCGGDGTGTDRAFSCTPENEKAWLRGYMNDLYFWAGLSPDPAPAAYADVRAYLDARRFQGNATDPRDRFSYIEGEAAFNEFFVDGQTVGYGVSVNGSEGKLPLKVRYVDPNSAAAAAGVKRGDTVVSANGKTAASMVADADFSALAAPAVGSVLTLAIERDGVPQTLPLTATRYALQPVTEAKVLPLAGGVKAGYLSLKDFVTQAEAPLTNAIAQFRAEGASELILDLRYNGGGRVSTAAHLASLVAGATQAGQLFTTLVYNDRNRDLDSRYLLSSARAGAAFPRVVILTGPRTCSASEMVANGLTPYATVVTIGGTSCGKPVGFTPQACAGNVYSIVNFESLNRHGQGKYYKGLPLTCVVADEFSKPLGDPAETLTAAAVSYLQTGACPAVAAAEDAVSRVPGRLVVEPGERRGMFAD